MRSRPTLGVLAAALLLTGCSQGGNESTLTITGTPPAVSGGPTNSPTSSPTNSPTPSPDEGAGGDRARVVDTVATGLTAPWGLDFFDNGDAIVTERDTRRVLRISGPRYVVEQVGRIDIAAPEGEAGLLGVALSPDFSANRLVYFYVSTANDNRVVRATLEDGRLGPTTPLFTGIPRGPFHDGGRLEFGPDGFLYVSTGETDVPRLAQERDGLGGKILRLTRAGRPAPGNPFGTAVWSWGHRNVQGLAFAGRRLWASEFGADTFDELNLIESGSNYGWPAFEGKGGARSAGRGFVDPQITWRTDEASPSGLAYADGYLWMAALRGERLWRVTVKGGRASNPTPFFVGKYGRMRTVAVAPDGKLWLTTSNRDGRGAPTPGDDRILLVKP
ncbi:MAG: PQQ-dependent sugar dehydrogenase [Geodermatophilaceae bacterium]